MGECRRQPPQLLVIGKLLAPGKEPGTMHVAPHEFGWPTVKPTHWCGYCRDRQGMLINIDPACEKCRYFEEE